MKIFRPRLFDRFKAGNKYKAKLIIADDIIIKDISLGGVLLETEKHFNVNSTYKIQIKESDTKMIMPTGMVVWATLKGSVNKMLGSAPVYHVALKFIDLTDKEKEVLKNFIRKLEQTS